MTDPFKVIFLDMDGVTCTLRSHIAQSVESFMEALDREAIGLLNRLAAVGPIPVFYVLSSSWRKFHDRVFMEEHLAKFGWTGKFHEDWATGSSQTGFRGEEIALWLEAHNEATEYVIIDDDSDFFPGQAKYHVQPHYEDGLSWQDFLRANKILHGDDHAWLASRREAALVGLVGKYKELPSE